tara:strand:+ start:12680 stop:13333 length:654 start_codon:yes stop_codon:yes gene_type:complete
MTVISRETIDILKNFSSINKSIVIKPGSTIKTLSVNKNILAEASVEENIDSQISIYDLSSFLGCLSLFDQPQFDTSNSQYLSVSDSTGKSKTKFFYADPDVIVQPPDQDITLPSEDVTFTLTPENLNSLQRAAAVYQVPDLCLYGRDGKMRLCVTDKKNDTSNTYSVEVGETDKDYCYCFKIENLKLVPCEYQVTISDANVALFQGDNVKYWIALEP